MDDGFTPAATAIVAGNLDDLRGLLSEDPGLAKRTSSVSHPTLLQLVACNASTIVNAVGAARILMRALSTAAGLGDIQAIDNFVGGGVANGASGPIGSPFADTVPAHLVDDSQSIVDHAFVMSVNNRQREAANVLLQRGAKVNATPPGYHWRGTALHAAVWRGDKGMVEWLLSVGADPSIRDGLAHSNATGWARHHGQTDILDLLEGTGS